MTYGKNFWVIGDDGQRIESLGKILDKKFFPSLHPFRYADGDGGWWLTRNFTIEVQVGKILYRITVKAGFDYDGASIPKLCHSWVCDKMDHRVIVAAMLHDLLYCVQLVCFPRDVCDGIIAGLMEPYGASAFLRGEVWSGVRVGGWKRWGEVTAEERAKYSPFLEVIVITLR